MSVKKYKLYATESGWETKHAALLNHFNLPNNTTSAYAEKKQVSNPDHSDFGKYIMPVKKEGTWKCSDQFSSGLVDYDQNWFLLEVPEE